MRPRRRHPVCGGESLLKTSASLSNQRDRLTGAMALALSVGGLLMAGPASADDQIMAAELGTGGVSRADLESTAAILTAPGTLALRDRYDIVAGGRIGVQSERVFQAAAVDSMTGPVALAIADSSARIE